MSGKPQSHGAESDPRAERTRDRLGNAMWALFQEKPFDAITVQELLDRAGVARSTFYTYFRDKNDLFVTDLDEFLERMATGLARRADAGDRVAPVRELFGHIGDQRKLYVAFIASGRIHEFFDLTRAHFTRGIEARLAELPRSARIAAPQRVALAHAFGGALVSLLSWWIDGGGVMTPAAVDELFHGMVWAAVGPV
jgi:AcrR family transcriptional regulator